MEKSIRNPLARLISENRTALAGFAALLILLYHSFIPAKTAVGAFFLGANSHIGVDIFTFLSGFGAAFSLEKDGHYGHYLKKRFRRLLPSYYLVVIPMWILARMPLRAVLISVIPVNVWFGSETLWYVSAAAGYALLLPLLYRILKRVRFRKLTAAGLVLLFSVPVPLLLRPTGAEIALMRIPAMVIGLSLGTAKNREEKETLPALLACAAIGVLIGCFGQKILPLTKRETMLLSVDLAAPALSILLAFLIRLCGKIPKRVLECAGRVSLEMYLIHLVIKTIAGRWMPEEGLSMFILLLVTSCPAAYVLSWCSKICLSGISALFKRSVPR